MPKGLRTIKLEKIHITDSLFGRYSELVAEKILPYQWDILNDRVEGAMPTYCIRNFRIAAGIIDGERKGAVFQDTDLYKWIEAVSYCIENGSGKKFEKIMDEAIELIGRAQQEDGYINTYYTITAPDKRWCNLVEGHELYTSGHLIEAAVAYYLSNGKKSLLDIAIKNADLICKVFGRGENQIKGYPGHQEIELALVKLYRITGQKHYLECARYFIDERGREPNYFTKEIEKRGGYEYYHEFDNYDLKYSQAHMKAVKQRSAEGHAVRAMYMYSAMADLALEYGDEKMSDACQALWENVTDKKMYVTASVGASGWLERFTADYDLPNNTNYSETCASIGLMMFGQRMNSLTKHAKYYDVVERALYNTVLAGLSIAGDRYFYVNPLEVIPDFCMDHTYMMHVKPSRQRWFSVACCPPNIARTLASLGQYIYAKDDESIYINQFISSNVESMIGNNKVSIELNSSIVKDGKVSLIITAGEESKYSIKIRVPEYSGQVKICQNGEEVRAVMNNGYACFRNTGEERSLIEIDFDVKARFVASNINVPADVGKVALMKGPCVYCLEEKDNGKNLSSIYVVAETEIREGKPLDLFGEIPTLYYEGMKLSSDGLNGEELYGKPHFSLSKVDLKAVPYCLWNNRGEGEMLVWHKARV